MSRMIWSVKEEMKDQMHLLPLLGWFFGSKPKDSSLVNIEYREGYLYMYVDNLIANEW